MDERSGHGRLLSCDHDREHMTAGSWTEEAWVSDRPDDVDAAFAEIVADLQREGVGRTLPDLDDLTDTSELPVADDPDSTPPGGFASGLAPGDLPHRSLSQDPDGPSHGDRSNRSDPSGRSDTSGRSDRTDQSGRTDQSDRSDRTERADRSGRTSRFGRRQRADRTSRGDKSGDGSGRGNGSGRSDTSSRGRSDRSGWTDAGDRGDRPRSEQPLAWRGHDGEWDWSWGTDDEHYVPPEPPPLPRLRPLTIVSLVLIALGVVLLIIPSLIGLDARIATPIALLSIMSGGGMLLLRARQTPKNPNGRDDGAQI